MSVGVAELENFDALVGHPDLVSAPAVPKPELLQLERVAAVTDACAMVVHGALVAEGFPGARRAVPNLPVPAKLGVEGLVGTLNGIQRKKRIRRY